MFVFFFIFNSFLFLFFCLSSEIQKDKVIKLSNALKTAWNSEQTTGSGNWRTVVGHTPINQKTVSKKTWHIRVDHQEGKYPSTIVGVGLVTRKGVRVSFKKITKTEIYFDVFLFGFLINSWMLICLEVLQVFLILDQVCEK